MMPALPALWQLQGSQPAAVFRGKCTCWGAGAAPSFCMNLPDSMEQWSQIKKNETNLKDIQSVMGHRDIATTMDIYAEATDTKKKESFDKLSHMDIF